MEYLAPFLEVIRSHETSGPITGVALTSVCRMLDQNILGAQSQLILAPLSPVNLILSTILYICYKLSLCRQEQCLLY